MEEAAFGRGHRDVHQASRFLQGTFLQLSDLDDGANARTELANGVVQDTLLFALQKPLLGTRSMVRDLEMLTGLVGIVQLIGRNLAGIADLTTNHECGIDDDAGEPGGKARPTVEAADMGVGTQEGILEGVLGVFAIARNVEGDIKQLCSVRPAKGFEEVRAAAAGGSQQLGLAALSNDTFRNTGFLLGAEGSGANHCFFLSAWLNLSETDMGMRTDVANEISVAKVGEQSVKYCTASECIVCAKQNNGLSRGKFA